MIRHIKFILIITCLAYVYSCSDQSNPHTPLEKDGTPPKQISNAEVTNLPGGAYIKYNLPTDDDLFYVLAEYIGKNGKTQNARASAYSNSITIEGFGDTKEYKVQLYAVDLSENKSKAVEVTINPLTPPVHAVASSVVISQDFGGFNFTFKNPTEADLAMIVITPDSLGEMNEIETFYTSLDSSRFAIRGYLDEPRLFGIVLRDKWQNLSDTIYQTVTPIYEIQLDKSLFKAMQLPSDSPTNYWGGGMHYIWDGKADNKAAHTGNVATGVPIHFTFDLGVVAHLSRFNLRVTQDDGHMYNDVSPRFYEVWGCTEYDSNGSFDGWTKLVSIENVKPSGLPVGNLTEDDRIAARQGDDANIPTDMPKVRYIRLRCLKNWSNNTNMIISEVTFWGSTK